MKDLDFDELDKAVNSLMTSVPKTPPPANAPEQEKTLDITPTIRDDEPLSFDKLDTATAEAVSAATPADEQKTEVVAAAAASLPVLTVVPAPAPAARRGGRFMDVVHPSSDMKKATMPLRPVSRQGPTLEPMVPSRSDAPRASTPFTPPVAVKAPEQSPVSVPEEPVTSDGWPDPLEMTDFKDDEVVPKEEEWSAPAPMSSEHDIEQSPLSSPFLPDTKVEKRPLGSGSLTPNDEDLDVLDEPIELREDKTVDDPNDQLPPMPVDTPPQLPEELQGDLMSVEADTHMGIPKTEQSHPMDEKLLESGLPEEPATKAVPVANSTGPVSIPQQYREEPSTSDQANAGIYDTDSYHQPLAHPAKKKSGWMWIIWIIVILLVGAGAGAAVFFSGILGK
jgi:hypothetical protein